MEKLEIVLFFLWFSDYSEILRKIFWMTIHPEGFRRCSPVLEARSLEINSRPSSSFSLFMQGSHALL